MPILSIVIANYNYGRFLDDAINSVLHQGYETEIELIIIDGGSSDNSLDIIKKHAGSLRPNLGKNNLSSRCPTTISYWVSEPDRGQSDAFNKGFARARGKYLTWLNADDIFAPGAVDAIIKQLKAHPDCEWFTGNFYRFNNRTGDVTEIGWGPHVYPQWMQRKNSPIVSFGPSTIFSKVLWERIGKIDESMHLMMDTDLWMRFIVSGIKQRRINHFIWGFRMHEDSKTAEFGDHKLDKKRLQRLAEENARSIANTGYHCSKFWRFSVLVLRLLDGSFLRRMILIAKNKSNEGIA